ncbi:MAG TPA: matrixin family metalloprotease [Polyangiaceae bacterium]
MKSRARGAKLGAAALCVVYALGWTTRAQAFCRSMSCELGEKSNNPCPRDENQCVTKGHALHWANPCLTYTIQVDGSPRSKLDADQVQAFVAQAFNAWKSAHCPGGGSPRFEAQFEGFVSCDRREAICDGADKNVNEVMFHDSSWLYGSNRMGVTTPTGGTESGLIVDADVEINSQDYSFKSDPTGTMSTSLRFVLTHELGHFLGLAHSLASNSVMSQGYQSLPFSSNLISPDDEAAICAVYPPGPKLNCGAPPEPVYDTCQIPVGVRPPCKLASTTQDSEGCGCRLAASSASPRLPMLGGFGLLLAALATRRARRGPRAVTRNA